MRESTFPGNTTTAGSRVNPVFDILAVPMVLHPLDMVSLAMGLFSVRGTSLAEHGP